MAEVDSLKTKIWLTYNSRIIAETRLKQYGLITHAVNVYFSLNLILYNILNDELSARITSFWKLTVVLSIVVFTFSVCAYAFRFYEKAALYRECYLKLQKIHSMNPLEADLSKMYFEVLDAYPNHLARDYNDFIVTNYLNGKSDLKDSAGNAIYVNIFRIFSYISRRVLFVLLWICLFILPAFPYMILIFR